MPARRERVVFISLDGLSQKQLDWLASKCSTLGRYLDTAKISAIVSAPHKNFQSVWAEALTGRPWQENGCSSYSRPGRSLSVLEIIDEDKLNVPVMLPRRSVLVNIPLVKPKSDRVWLSDGSMPTAATVAPAELLGKEPYRSYRPRPFSSSAAAACTVQRSARKAMRVEQQRLECCKSLLSRQDWNLCLLRINVFDELSHLLGSELWQDDQLAISDELGRFLSALDGFLKFVTDLGGITVYVSSFISHINCQARLSLNGWLQRQGYATLTRNRADDPVIMTRTNAVKAALGETLAVAEPMTSQLWQIDPAKTLAASPVAGAIFINRKSCFEDGIVADSEAEPLLSDIQEALEAYLQREFGSTFDIYRNQSKAPGPDMLVNVEGVEFFNLEGAKGLDRVNKPKSTHCAKGFLCQPAGCNKLSGLIKPIDVNQLFGAPHR